MLSNLLVYCEELIAVGLEFDLNDYQIHILERALVNTSGREYDRVHSVLSHLYLEYETAV